MSDQQLETTVTIGSKTFSVSRMSAFEQMHLIGDARILLTGLALLKRDRPKEMNDASFLQTASTIVASTGGLPVETRERIWNICLRQVKLRQAAGWQPILADAGVMQFADIDPPTITRLLYSVFEHNKLLDFFSESLSNSDGQMDQSRDGQLSTEERIG